MTTQSMTWLALALCAMLSPACAPSTVEVCTVHQTPLEDGKADILYGMIAVGHDHREAEANFPNAHDYILGGCVISDDSPDTRAVEFCPDCRRQKRQWLASHEDDR